MKFITVTLTAILLITAIAAAPVTSKLPISSRQVSPTPTGRFRIKVDGVLIGRSHDGIFRGCADPTIYGLYLRVIPGVVGSTRVINLGRQDIGTDVCQEYVSLSAFQVTENNLPVDRTVFAAYVIIAVERDSNDLADVASAVSQHLAKLEDLFRAQESAVNVNPNIGAFYVNFPDELETNANMKIPEFERPSGTGHEFIGERTLFLISTPSYGLSQPSTCFDREPGVCEVRSFSDHLIFEEAPNEKNKWLVDYEVEEF